MSLLGIFFICVLILVLLEPKLIGALLYWAFILALGFIGWWALILWMIGA